MKQFQHAYLLILLSLSSSLLLHGMQDLIVLDKVLNLAPYSDVTSICFDDTLSKCAYVYVPDSFPDTIYMGIVNTADNTSTNTSMQISPVERLCFNGSSDKVAMLTDEGKVGIFDCNQQTVGALYDNKVFSSVTFGQNKCFAGTYKGAVFTMSEGKSKQIFEIPEDEWHNFSTIAAMACDKPGVNIALVGLEDVGGPLPGGYMQVIPVEHLSTIATKTYNNEDYNANTRVQFDESGSWIVLASGKMAMACNLTSNTPSSENVDFAFRFDSPVTEVIFGATKDYLFIGLEDGSVYFAESKNALNNKNPKGEASLLFKWEHSIQALSYNNQKLGVATLYKAALFRFLLDR